MGYLGSILQILTELISVGRTLKAHRKEKFFKDIHKAIKDLRNAITDEEKANAAKAISDLFRRLG